MIAQLNLSSGGAIENIAQIIPRTKNPVFYLCLNNYTIQGMMQSFSQILAHVVFSTKKRILLLDDNITTDLYPYITNILKNHKCCVLQIGGTENHIHILCALAKNLTMGKVVEEVKTGSSKWIKTKSSRYEDFYWQHGYGAFSVSPSHVAIVRNYIANQKQHHEKFTFEDEFRRLLQKYNVAFDEKYLFDD